MNEFIEIIFTYFGNEKILPAAVIAFGLLYLIKKEPFKLITYFREEKIKDIDQAVSLYKSKAVGSETKELIKDYVESYSFNKLYGFKANKKERSVLLDFYKKYQSQIGWHNLKRAFSFIKFDDEKISIQIKKRHIFERWLISVLSWSLAGFALLIYLLANTILLVNDASTIEFARMVSISLILLVPALMFGSLNFPYHSAKKIKKILEEEHSEISFKNEQEMLSSSMQIPTINELFFPKDNVRKDNDSEISSLESYRRM